MVEKQSDTFSKIKNSSNIMFSNLNFRNAAFELQAIYSIFKAIFLLYWKFHLSI